MLKILYVPLFNLPSDRVLRGDLIYTSTGKIIVSTFNITAGTGSFFTQFTYAGSKEVESSLGNVANGISFYINDSEFFYVANNQRPAFRARKNLTSPYGTTTQSNMTQGNLGFAQPLSCLNVNFIP